MRHRDRHGTSLRDALLYGATVCGADLGGADVRGAILTVKAAEGATWPSVEALSLAADRVLQGRQHLLTASQETCGTCACLPVAPPD